ncbi:MAG: PHP domain-containing protein [Candidatus Aenigmatarchaeota archaeon]
MTGRKGLKIDFHVHSHFSSDGDMTPEEIIRYAKKAGLDAIAVTDHNSLRGGKEVEKLSKDLIVLVGSEIKTDAGEIIALNIKKDIERDLGLEETCKLVKEQGGFIIISHPFDRFRSGIGSEAEKIVKYIDAVEVFNARTMVGKFNDDALAFARKHNLPCVAGSDSHFASELGSAYTLVMAENKKDIFKAIRQGRTEIAGRKTGIMPHWRTFIKNMNRKL